MKLWNIEQSKLPVEIGLEITVCHYPRGTSKWSENEHKMFSFISMNWRGLPLVSFRTITELISATTTANGLTIRAEEDLNHYETGTKVRAPRLNTACRRRPRQPSAVSGGQRASPTLFIAKGTWKTYQEPGITPDSSGGQSEENRSERFPAGDSYRPR